MHLRSSNAAFHRPFFRRESERALKTNRLGSLNWRLVRKRCGVCSCATSKAARIGPIEGIWRSNFTA